MDGMASLSLTQRDLSLRAGTGYSREGSEPPTIHSLQTISRGFSTISRTPSHELIGMTASSTQTRPASVALTRVRSPGISQLSPPRSRRPSCGVRCRWLGSSLPTNARFVGDGISGKVLTLTKGTEIEGRYVIHDVVGTGGYASVWKASDKQLSRDVALKRLFKQGTHSPDEELAKILEEARKHAQLVHTNIV